MNKIVRTDDFCKQVEDYFEFSNINYIKTSGWYTAQHVLNGMDGKCDEGYIFECQNKKFLYAVYPFSIDNLTKGYACIFTDSVSLVHPTIVTDEYAMMKDLRYIADTNGLDFIE